MERKVETTTLETPISSVANIMLSEGYELIPVIDSKNTLLGVVTRKIVINSLLTNNRFQDGNNNDTFDEIMRKGIVPRAGWTSGQSYSSNARSVWYIFKFGFTKHYR